MWRKCRGTSGLPITALRTSLSLGPRDVPWRPPILKTVAATGEGVPELLDAIDRHLTHLKESGRLVYPQPTGVIEILEKRGFKADQGSKARGNIHFEEYW